MHHNFKNLKDFACIVRMQLTYIELLVERLNSPYQEDFLQYKYMY